MKKFNVKFYYSATGVADGADERDYGTIEALNKKDAVETVLNTRFPKMNELDRSFTRGCLTAKELK